MAKDRDYDLVIVGAGVSGCAVLYVAALFTNIRRIAVIEKYQYPAQVNSSPKNNSQTLHFGDIETNYSLSKALPIKEAGHMIARYVTARPGHGLYELHHKMVLGVGLAEVSKLEERFAAFREAYPGLRLIYRDEIAKLEPMVVNGRDIHQPICALLSADGYAVNYQKLADSFLNEALSVNPNIDVYFGTRVESIHKARSGFVLRTDAQEMTAKTVIVASGPHSMLFAQELGYGKDLGMLPVAGSFYFTPKVLSGKVYTVQKEGFPFAAVHGDPDVVDHDHTRFGPTAKLLPLLERHRYGTLADFLKTKLATLAGVWTLARLASTKAMRNFILANFLYDLPVIGKHLYVRHVRKIIPTIRPRDMKLGKHIGGIRPQVVDTKTAVMQPGESKIIGDGIIFNTTPSPGASVSLRNGERDIKEIVEFLGQPFNFDHISFDRNFR